MKNKKLLAIIPLVIAVAVFIGVYLHYYSEDGNSLTVLEKKWINENVDKLIDIDVITDYPIYGDKTGVFNSFIEGFEGATDVKFNQISYLKEDDSNSTSYRFQVLNNDVVLKDKDLLIGEDVYVLVGKEYKKINKITDLENLNIGVLTEDVANISYYLSSSHNITYKSYDSSDKMFEALDKGDINMVAIPHIQYLNKIFDKDYSINFTLAEMSKKLVLTLDNKNDKLNSIVTKYFNAWKKDTYVEVYNQKLFNYYIANNNIKDSDTKKLQAKTYTYGFVKNSPYEIEKNGVLYGICGEYISRINRLTGIDFKYKEYDTVEDLLKAVKKKEVDIYFNYYDFATQDYKEVNSTFVEEYVVLSKTSSSNVVTSFESLKGKDISMVGNTALFNYFKDNSKAVIKEYDDFDTLLKKSKDNIVVVDKEVYSFNKNGKFKNYEVLYSNVITKDYSFMVINTEEKFYNIFNYIVNSNSYYRYRNTAFNNLNDSKVFEADSFEELYIVILVIILVPVMFLIAIYIILSHKSVVKKVKKEERRKYTDNLTSLKNRSYLNLNMEAWNKSEKYPQSVVVIDLNNVKYVNDNYGHEAGDGLIVQAASTLVNTQLENSEIIRTDGNEFLIYLVGYSEKQVEIYTKKLTKEFKELPYGFGAAVGYSMITDGMKTIDDAINEAVLEMRTDKEEYK